jgi:hypothetical protein
MGIADLYCMTIFPILYQAFWFAAATEKPAGIEGGRAALPPY